jgi:hypothetical protein
VPNGMVYIGSRRVGDRVWIKGNHMMLPNFGQTTALWEGAAAVKYFTGVSLTKWIVPVDDTHCLMLGYRHFNDEVDPAGVGREDGCGVDAVDFFGQTRARDYEAMQREPGDWEAQVSQRPIAIHALEHLGDTDRGVARLRRLLRRAVRGEIDPAATLDAMIATGRPVHTYCYDTVLAIPPRGAPDDAEDRALLRRLGKEVVDIVLAADGHDGEDRRAVLRAKLRALEAREGAAPAPG